MMKKVFKSIMIILSIIMFSLTIYIMVFGSMAVKNNRLINIFGYSYALVPSDSMKSDRDDSFQKGDLVFLKLSDYNHLKPEDVVVYRSNLNILIVHRITRENPNVSNTFYLKGDALDYEDPELLTNDNYQAKVIGHIKFINMSDFLKNNRLLLIFIITMIILGFVILQIIQIILTIQKDKLKKLKETLDSNKEI